MPTFEWQNDEQDLKQEMTAAFGDDFAAVSEGMRNLLRQGVVSPGDIVSETDFIRHLRVRDIPCPPGLVRKVLFHLETDRLVSILPKKGSLILCPKASELRQIWDSRLVLEEFVVVTLARKRIASLSKSIAILDKMRAIAARSSETSPTPSQDLAFREQDRAFHASLAAEAGFPSLADELDTLRLRLQLAARTAAMRNMNSIVDEHETILRTLQPKEGDWTRPDINAVRLAMRIHLRNSAKYWLKLEPQLRYDFEIGDYDKDYVFDLPAGVLRPCASSRYSVFSLLTMRLAIELHAARRLATLGQAGLESLERINRQMARIAENCWINSNCLNSKESSRFLNLDVEFHGAICFLSGLLFAEEAVVYSWRQLYGISNENLDGNRLRAIVKEHEDVIRAIRNSTGDAKSINNVIETVKEHFVSASARNLVQPSEGELDRPSVLTESEFQSFRQLANDFASLIQEQPSITHPTLLLPVSAGEVFDKLTNLEIESHRISDATNLGNIRKEQVFLTKVIAERYGHVNWQPLVDELRKVNNTLWDNNEALRQCEAQHNFGDSFIQLARSMYIENDRRSLLKHSLNELIASQFREEKTPADY